MADLSLTTDVNGGLWFADNRLQDRLTTALNSRTHAERWKYTKSQQVLQMLPVDVSMPDINAPSGVSIDTLSATTDNRSAFDVSVFDATAAPEACAVLAHHQRAVHIKVEATPGAPIYIEHGGNSLPIVITCMANVALELIETAPIEQAQQQTVWINLGANSRLIHSRNSFATARQWQYLQVDLQRDAHYTLHNHTVGSELRRQDLQINHRQPGASSNLFSAAVNHGKRQIDQQLTINHLAAHTTSAQVFHNIGLDAAKTTFNGRIYIAQNCPGVDAQLTNKNLSLGEHTVFNTKPELEIYTDDVKCSHGATVGQIDAQQLFYFASRGIPNATAFKMLADAFLQVCIGGPLAEEATAGFERITGT